MFDKVKKNHFIFLIVLIPIFALVILLFVVDFVGPRGKLSLAIESGDINTVERLLSINKNLVNEKRDSSEPLHEAALFRQTKIAKLLIGFGANINAKGMRHNSTPLSVAAAKGDIEMMRLLINSGAIVDIKNDLNKTPLILAAEHGNKNALELLISMGADLSVRSKYYNKTALGYAVEFGNSGIVKILLEHGAKENINQLISSAKKYLNSMPEATEEIKGKYKSVIKILEEAKKRGE